MTKKRVIDHLICHQMYGGQDITIIFISDVHLGSEYCFENEFRSLVKWICETPNVYVVLGGDLIENAGKNSPGDGVFHQESPREQIRMLQNILEPLAEKGRILAIVNGNHEFRTKKDSGFDIMWNVASYLRILDRFREYTAYIKIQLGNPVRKSGVRSESSDRPTYVICVTHGSGGGMTGSGVNMNEKYGRLLQNVDLLLVGHRHQPYTVDSARISVDSRNNLVTVDEFKFVSGTGWLEYGGYPVQRMLPPTAFRIQKIILSGKQKNIEVRQ